MFSNLSDKKMTINPIYKIGERVYIIHDPDQFQGMVTALKITPFCLLYQVSIGDKSDFYYDFEISTEKTIY